MSALAQFLLLGQDKIGSLSLSKDQTDFFTMSVNATADIISEAWKDQIIPRLMALNGQTAEGLVLEHSPAGDVDLTMIADFLQKTGAMITWTPEDEAWLRSTARLPERTPEEIEQARELDRQQRLEERAAFMPAFGNSDDEDDFDLFAAGTAPDDDDRRKSERKLNRVLRNFWKGQKKRVVSGARKI